MDKKRMLGILMAGAVTLSLLPTVASAADGTVMDSDIWGTDSFFWDPHPESSAKRSAAHTRSAVRLIIVRISFGPLRGAVSL